MSIVMESYSGGQTVLRLKIFKPFAPSQTYSALPFIASPYGFCNGKVPTPRGFDKFLMFTIFRLPPPFVPKFLDPTTDGFLQRSTHYQIVVVRKILALHRGDVLLLVHH